MVRDTEARLGCVLDNGSSPRRRGDKERQADKGNKGISPTRQGEPEVVDNSEESIKKLNVSVITQAVKDICSSKGKDHRHEWSLIMDWVASDFFEEVCDCAGVDVDYTRSSFQELYDMPLRIRRDLVKKRRADAGVR